METKKKHIAVDLANLGHDDAENLRLVLTSKDVPDGVKRFCTAVLFKSVPELSVLAGENIKDTHAFEQFCMKAVEMVVRDGSFAQMVGVDTTDLACHFAFWLTRLLRTNMALVPDCDMKRSFVTTVERVQNRMQEDACDCEECRHKPTVLN